MLPLALLGVGGLLLARSELLDVRPFRLGLGVGFFGLMVLLGKDNGGWIGLALGGAFAGLIGDTGAAIIGGALLLGGALLVSGARLARSCGARDTSFARRLGRATRPRLDVDRDADGGDLRERRRRDEPIAVRHVVDGAEAYPDVVSSTSQGENALLVRDDEPDFEPESLESVFETSSEHAEYRSSDRGILPLAGNGGGRQGHGRAHGRAARADAHGVRDRRERPRTDLGPARDPLRAPARSRTKVAKVAALKDDLSYAGHDRDPHPRSHPWKAGRRSGGAEPLPRLVTLGDIYDDLPQPRARSPSGWARTSPATGLDRPRPHAAPADRRDDRIGEVGLHQHDPDLDALRATPDDVRMILIPEADRARLLRVDPPPADAGGLEPEGVRDGAHERRAGDGAPVRAALARARPQPARGEPCAGRAARRRCRTSWS